MSQETEQVETQSLSSSQVEEAVETLANQVHAQFAQDQEIAFVGILTRGVTLAHRVAEKIREKGREVPVGSMDISLYRDDLDIGSALPRLQMTEIPFELEDMRVILFDDVIYTGRTIRAALEVISDYGRPAKIELAVLVDRGWREVPIQPDYVGYLFETRQNERVSVRLKEYDGEDGVFLTRQPDL